MLKRLGFQILIALDRLLNVLTGGSFMICLSTRAYIRAQSAKPMYRRKQWVKVENAINWLFFDSSHCKNSYLWEVRIKEKWLADNKEL